MFPKERRRYSTMNKVMRDLSFFFHRLRDELWEDLSSLAFRWDAPCCIALILMGVFPKERHRCSTITSDEGFSFSL